MKTSKRKPKVSRKEYPISVMETMIRANVTDETKLGEVLMDTGREIGFC